MLRILAILAAVAAVTPPPAVAEEVRRVAFLGLTYIDTSLGATTPEEEARLAAVHARLEEAFAADPRYVLVATAPAAERLGRISNIADCNGCDSRIARDLGADLAMTGEVQKTSNLILHMTVYLRDAETGALVGGGSADIRGNTDESWRRGIDWLIRNRLLKE